MQALSGSNLVAAVQYNREKHYGAEIIRDIQRLVGAKEDGDPGPETVKAIARWQAEEQLEPDGKLGELTLLAIQEEWRAAERGAPGGDEPDEKDDGEPDHNTDEAHGRFVDLRGAKRTKDRGKPKGTRKWSQITGITLHQTACVFSGPQHPGVVNVPVHAMTFADGQVVLLNSPTAYMRHGNGLNRTDIGIEVNCHACGIEGVFTKHHGDPGPNTFWRSKLHPESQPVEATDQQLEATKQLIRYYVEQVKANGGEIQFIHAHRQASEKTSDPGSRIWRAVGVWAQQEFGLEAGPTDDYCIGAGAPIPTAWDPRVVGVAYSGSLKGY